MLFIHNNIKYFSYQDKITFIDVGQGDSILLELGNKNVLVDTGGNTFSDYNMALNKLIPYFKSLGIKKIDYLILSHGDYDHMGESINLINDFKVSKVIFNKGKYNDLELDLIKLLDDKKISYYQNIKQLNINNHKLYFLNDELYADENDNSLIIYTIINGYKIMLMGDASNLVEKDIIQKYKLDNIDILKVGHHGSKTSSSKEFIEVINPKYAVISVGANNWYGHPNKEILENLNTSNIYRTDINGSIKIKLDKLEIKTCLS